MFESPIYQATDRGVKMEMGVIIAYIDAGTGSILVQVLAGGAAAVLIFSRQFKDWVSSVFHKNQKDSEPDE